MFAVLYRWRVKPGFEQQFRENWARMTEEFRTLHGGLGSALHQNDDGQFVAYARWPDRATWEREKKIEDTVASAAMSEAVSERLAPWPLEVTDDMLVNFEPPQIA
ncbi:MAG: antibiotic biosynthesis monooxygenase [Myxococcota bacterium]